MVIDMEKVVTLEKWVNVDRTLEAKVQEYYELKKQIEEMQKYLKKLGKEIGEELGEGEHKVGIFKVKIEKVKQHRLDTRKAKAILDEFGYLDEAQKVIEFEKMIVKQEWEGD